MFLNSFIFALIRKIMTKKGEKKRKEVRESRVLPNARFQWIKKVKETNKSKTK